MDDKIIKIIDEQRRKRGFNVDKYISDKIHRINNFFRFNNLDSAVVGISGGVDSALVLALLHEAKKAEDSPIKKIRCLVMPIRGNGVSNQEEAANIAIRLIDTFKAEYQYLDLTDAYNAMVDQKQESLGEHEAWANGQMASVLRTPMFYYQAAILQTQGYKSIVVGTTNRDEGSYIGFFGKASDAMVDLQPIADLHKSEVYKVAKELGVTDEILKATPKGDVWDQRVDEEMIGAPYHFLEDYLLLLEYAREHKIINIFFLDDAKHRFNEQEIRWIENIEKLHKINEHKYEVGNPAHFIDVLKRKIQLGWS